MPLEAMKEAIMEESILNTIKNSLGISEDCDSFDSVIMTHINLAFATLFQMGLGPENGYCITDKHNEWSEFTDSENLLNFIKVYIGSKVRLAFDPPQNSNVINAINAQITEIEWRLSIMASSSDGGESK